MKANNTKKKLLKLIIYSIVIILSMFSLKSYYYYQDIKSDLMNEARKEAHLLKDYMMSVRQVYHNQFLGSGVALNEKTLGFLPAHATTLISDLFQKENDYSFYIRNVSDTPRNIKNMADAQEIKAIEFFKRHSDEKEYFIKYTDTDGEHFQFATPIYIKPYCLACHGTREEALPTIRDNYTSAYNYKVGDIRGVVSIKIPGDKVNERFYKYVLKELIATITVFMLIITVFFIIFKQLFLQINIFESEAIDYAVRDALTGLFNRKYLSRYTEDQSYFLNEESSFIVAFLDIDYFKSINDTYGHDMGDEVLKKFAFLLESLSREEDIVCRYGGEEFLIIVYNISLEQGVNKFNQIRLEIEKEKIELNGKTSNITVSIGLSIGNIDNSLEEVIANADKALYKAKENGRNRVEVF